MAKRSIPRFVLSLQDTKTEIDGPLGRQYYNITIGFSSKKQLLEAHSEIDGRSELLNVIDTFFDTVGQLGKRRGGSKKSYTAVEIKKEKPSE